MEYKVTNKRNRKIKDAINKASKQIIEYAIKNQISEIIVGYNKVFKSIGVRKIIRKNKKFKFDKWHKIHRNKWIIYINMFVLW